MDHARTQATDTRQEVETISGDHLQTVLHLPRAERAKHVYDPELTPVDRQTLIDALAGEAVTSGGWRPAPNSSRRDTLLRFWGQNRHRAPATIQALALFGPLCIFALTAYGNTGERVDGVPGSVLEFRNPDGSHYPDVIGRGTKFVMVRHFGEFYARVWEDRQGYALAPVTVN